jgi:cell division protein FtsB
MTIYSINNHNKISIGKAMPRRVSALVAHPKESKDRYSSQRGSSMGIFLSGLGILSIVVAAGFLYIFQVTSSAVGGYDTTSLEKQIVKLHDERRDLEMQVADLQSLQAIEQGAKKLQLVASDKVMYTSPIADNNVVAFSKQGSDS